MHALQTQNALDHMRRQESRIADLEICVANGEAARQRLLARCNSLTAELEKLAPSDLELMLLGQEESTPIPQDIQLVAIEKMLQQHPELYESILTQVYLAWSEDEHRHADALAAEDRAGY